ncbi:MAG TPA: pyruvate, phosphate dikinase [Acholeplasmatales bacterium]|nr:pyruvate phosphate dikinase [Clostridium sp. CAG:307]HCS25116.1 pyruvate, phosphate dikinase [Acholeplasmatales bacterium]
MSEKYVYHFEEAYGLGKELLGGKGAGLAEMTHIGVSIPQGFTITTEACTLYYENEKKLPSFLIEDIKKGIKEVERKTKKHFGGNRNPLLVSVRSGARVSMPGMMDTILNLGLNDMTVEALARETNNERFAYDSYRRFILMFTNIAKGHPRTEMDMMLERLKQEKGYKLDTEVKSSELKELVEKYKDYYKSVFNEEFPTDPYVQLIEAVEAVFRSWDNPRANVYRMMNNIPYSWGTAVNVQSMAFGNKGETSGTGVAFSRNPATGEKKVSAEYLPNAQGEDVVAGIRTPLHIDELKKRMPEVYEEFMATIKRMEAHYKDMQDMEFTVEDGHLYFLQTRNGKRTPNAALKMACDMVDEGLITTDEAVLRIDANSFDKLLLPNFKKESLDEKTPIAIGLPAGPGAGTGYLAFSAEEAERRHKQGKKVILVRAETSPEDIVGMISAEAVLTMRGGMTSHAAVVARGMGKCCVCGCAEALIDEVARTVTINNKIYTDKDIFSIDGSTGNVYLGEIEMESPDLTTGYFGRLMKWVDEKRRLKVRTNADNARDAKQALLFGAEGIGLCRTEHMFFERDRIFSMRKMILASTHEERVEALNELLPIQQSDFEELYTIMDGKNVNVRLLDPPLHEFLPNDEALIEELASSTHHTALEIKDKIKELHESNPMMGHRGCRLAVTYPEICVMQTSAIINAAINVSKRTNKLVNPEIMVPLVLDKEELKFVKNIITTTANKLILASGLPMKYHVGTMIEVPRAALLADEIASYAEFFSFGTNDLTQMTMGFSRDDSDKFLPAYYENKILEENPFKTLDQKGVGKLISNAVKLGRMTNKDLHIGVCGETGGDPKSIEFYHKAGLDYISCSPFRVPVARLAAAQAAIKNK